MGWKSEAEGERDRLIVAVREARRLDRETAVMKGRRDRAMQQVVDIVGGDKQGAIYNGERRIGDLMTNDTDESRKER